MMQFNAHGTREGVLRKLADLHPKPPEGQPDKFPAGTDRQQVEALRALIKAEVEAIDPKANGVYVHVEGTVHSSARSIQVIIQPRTVDV